MVKLEVRKLSKSFKKNKILQDINLELKSPEIFGIIGKSGGGKSTLLKILSGYYSLDKGEIFLDGKKISGELRELREIIGYTTQDNSFYDELTVWENMIYYSKLYNIPQKERRNRINHLLTQVGLINHKNTISEKLSGGMKRRLDFSISLIHNPSVLIMDEPTTGLDPILVHQFWNIVNNVVSKEEKIVIMTSHIITEIEKYCTKVAIVKNGTITKILNRSQIKNLDKRFEKLLEEK
ncbi:MAG: ABC transporter ATP-binding protein [Candidatus Woesearchaeota archaeon]